jgi:tricorn protease
VYAGFVTRDDRIIGRIPTGRWAKPSALLQNASAYSDGSIFPHLYKSGGIGPIVGDNVPGTGTAVWWMYPMKGRAEVGHPAARREGLQDRLVRELGDRARRARAQ